MTRRRAARFPFGLVHRIVPLYAAGLVLLVATFQLGGDRWWWATLGFYAPRWLWVVPFPPLVGGVLLAPREPRRGRSLVLLALSAGLLAGPILGFVISPAIFGARGSGAPKATGRTLRVLTANVEREVGDGALLSRIIARERPDIVALQEWDDRLAVAWPPGWRVIRPGPELLIASGLPFDEGAAALWPDPPGEPVNMALAVLRTEFGPVRFLSLHLTSPRVSLGEMASRRTLVNLGRAPELERALAARRAESRKAAAFAASLTPAPLLVAGDFNMPDDSRIFRDTWAGFTNAFRTAGFGIGATIQASLGPIPVTSRIDHQLAGPGWRCLRAWVGASIGSDHRPLIADWSWSGPTAAPDRRSSIPTPAAPSAAEFRTLEVSFDNVAPGGLPAGCSLWRNGQLARGGVAAEAGRGGVLVLDTEDSGADVRAWLTGTSARHQEFQVDLRLDSLNPIRLLVGGRDFATRVPTAGGLELIRGMRARLLAVEPDSAREVARVRSLRWQESDWLRVTLRRDDQRLRARIERITDGAWLTWTGEWAPAPAGWTLEAGEVALPAGDLAGVWRVAGYAGPILTDNWRLSGLSPSDEALPTR